MAPRLDEAVEEEQKHDGLDRNPVERLDLRQPLLVGLGVVEHESDSSDEEESEQEQERAHVDEDAEEVDLVRVSDCSFDTSDLQELSVNKPVRSKIEQANAHGMTRGLLTSQRRN